MKRIRVVQIGVAHDHAAATFETLCRMNDLFDVVGYAVPEGDDDTRASKPAYAGRTRLTVEQALSDPTLEAVVIETSEQALTKTALECAKRGLHIHMDKPGGLTLSDFEALVNTVKEQGNVFHMGYMYRYNPAIIDLLGMIRRGDLGEIISVEAQMNCWHKPEKRAWLGQFPGGMTFFLGCHLVDLILQIQGTPMEVMPMNLSSGLGSDGADDTGFVVFRYPRSYSFLRSIATEVGGFHRRQLVVTGTEATVELKPLEYNRGIVDERYLYTDMTLTTDKSWHCTSFHRTYGPYGRYDAMIRNFAQVIRKEAENRFSPDYEVTLFRTLLECCRESGNAEARGK